MVRPLRDLDPSRFKLVTVRTNLAQMWMIPSRRLNQMIGGILARYQESEGIEIFAFCILSNHIHLLVRCTEGRIEEFFENVNREIARRVNRINGRISNFWARRYDMQPILTDDDLLEAYLYVTTNPVKHGLVSETRKWPGLSSYHQSTGVSEQTFSFTHYSLRDARGNAIVTKHVLKISRLPIFDNMNHVEYRDRIRSIVKQREQLLQKERGECGKGFLGVRAILRQVPGTQPRDIARSRRPICYTKCATARKMYRSTRKWIRALYTEASRRFRSGKLDVIFPEYCHKPPLHKIPIERPRKVLDEKYGYSALPYRCT